MDGETLKKVKSIYNKILTGGNVTKEERQLLKDLAKDFTGEK